MKTSEAAHWLQIYIFKPHAGQALGPKLCTRSDHDWLTKVQSSASQLQVPHFPCVTACWFRGPGGVGLDPQTPSAGVWGWHTVECS